jgi:hypothetical protein
VSNRDKVFFVGPRSNEEIARKLGVTPNADRQTFGVSSDPLAAVRQQNGMVLMVCSRSVRKKAVRIYQEVQGGGLK